MALTRRRALGAYLVAVAVLAGLYLGLAPAAGWLYATVPALTAVAVAAAARLGTTQPPRLAWYGVAAGTAVWAAADLAYRLAVAPGDAFPAVPDVLYLAGYPLLVVSVLADAREAGEARPWSSVPEPLVVGVAVAALIWELVVHDGGHSVSGAQAVALLYPLLDAAMAAALTTALARAGMRQRQVLFLCAAWCLTMLADLFYARMVIDGIDGRALWLDGLWLAGYALIGAAALSPPLRETQTRPARREVVNGLLVASMFVPLVLLALHKGRDLDMIVAATVIWLLVIVRLDQVHRQTTRVAAERAHAASVLRAAFEATAEAILVTDLQQRGVLWNARFAEMWGVPPGDEHPAVVDDVTRLLATDLGADGTDELRLADGRRIVCSSHSQLIDGLCVGRVWTMRDVTAQALAEAALRNSERRFRETFRNVRLLGVSLDLDLVVLDCNPYFLEVTGWMRREVVGRRWDDVVLPDAAARAVAHRSREQLLAEGVVDFHHNAIVTTRGERRTIAWNTAIVSDVDGAPVGVTLVGEDVTEQLRAEDELRRSERRFRALIERSEELVDVLDASGAIAYDSPSGAHLLGDAHGTRVGRSIFDDVHPDDVEQARAVHRAALASHGRAVPFELRVVDAAQEPHVLSGSWTNLLNDPDVRGIVVNARDVTAAREAEAALQASREQLLHAQKLEAVARLAGGVAHDFNNLLTAIRGYSELLLMRLADDEPARRDALEIADAADRASALTRQLLTFSRRQVVQPVALQLNDVVAGLESLLRRLIGEHIVLETDLEPRLGLVRGDASQVEQVLANLVVNARDAMPDGGVIAVTTRTVAPGAQPETLPAGSYVLLSVVDSGTGMDAETLAHVFEPFYTTKGHGAGTGLGLATVYGIVQQAGGEVAIDSAPGSGTRVDVFLPSVGGCTQQRPEKEPPSAAGAETILLVEDEALVRDLARRVLAERGYRVLEAAGAPEALDLLDGYDGELDLLLTDVVMPTLNGRELAERVQEERPTLRVLYMSGYTPDEILQRGVEERGLDFLAKPFTPERLARKVREVLDGAAIA